MIWMTFASIAHTTVLGLSSIRRVGPRSVGFARLERTPKVKSKLRRELWGFESQQSFARRIEPLTSGD